MNNKHFMRNLRLTLPAHYAGRTVRHYNPVTERLWLIVAAGFVVMLGYILTWGWM